MIYATGKIGLGGFKFSRASAGEWGFSLTEVMVAMILIAVVVVGSAGYFYHTLAMIEDYRSRRIAMDIATSEIDEIRKTHYNDVRSYQKVGLEIGNWDAEVVVEVDEQREGDARYKNIKVTVNWGMPVGDRNLNLQTIVGRK